MKNRKAANAMAHLDEDLILSAMDASDLQQSNTRIIKGGKGMKHFVWKKWGSLAAMLAIVLSAVLLVGAWAAGASEAVIAFDVNPSIEIEINKKEEIKNVKALNTEAELVLAGMELQGVDLEIAVNAIIGSMVKQGYLSSEQNSILISVASKSGKQSGRLQEELAGKINALLGNSNISASVLTQSFETDGDGDARADKNNISKAKSALISKIVAAGLLDAHGVPYSYETLAKLKVNELKLILESKSLDVQGIASSGTASGSKYISAEQALELALQKAGLRAEAVNRAECELDFDDDRAAMVYEVEFLCDGQKYEYELLAESGEIVEEEIEPADADDERNEEAVALPENAITREAALQAAYTDAGVAADAVKRPEIELDEERGICVYEIEFKANGMEYEYTVNAITGEILTRESEPID